MILQQYCSFILIVGAVGVAINYCPETGQFRIFDSHARDIYGNSHPLGTCVLLRVSCIDRLVQYFQSLYGLMDTYELKGIKITQISAMSNTQNPNTSNALDLQCTVNFATCLYSICYSIISPWNLNTINAIEHNASSLSNSTLFTWLVRWAQWISSNIYLDASGYPLPLRPKNC